YTYSIQHLLECFNAHAVENNCLGVCIADSRTPALNASVSHSIFTQKLGTSGKYTNIVELPSFGHSQNHVGLQLADIVHSGIISPIACWCYCRPFVANTHVHQSASVLRDRFGERLRKLQYRCEASPGKHWGGITVSDPVNHQSGARLFS